jgi:TM2 domain-containing membrane protein YozV
MNVRPASEYYAPRVLLLCGWLGFLGIHRFYTGKIITGLLQLITAGGFGIWWIIDFVLIVAGAFKDSAGRPVVQWNYGPSNTPKRILPAFLLNAFLGVFGIHRFYVGKIGTGLLQLVTVGGFGIWWIVDHVLITWGSFTDKQQNRLTQWT